MASQWIAGLDLGQAADYSALAAVERSEADGPDGRAVNAYAVRLLERFPLGTPYTAVVARVAAVLSGPALSGCYLAVDQTGVGRAVVDQFRASGPLAALWPITITAGAQVSQKGREFHVPKRELVGTLQVALQNRRLQIAKGLSDAVTLQRELANFRVKITAAANETFGTWREGQHDDLVLAVALAVWLGERLFPAGGSGVIGLPAPHQRTLVPMPGRR